MTVTVKEYTEEKMAFLAKHDFDYQLETSSMDEYGVYTKFYNFTDGAQWYERMAPRYDTITTEVRKVMMSVQVKLLETEYWSSESKSRFYYEKF